jgi:hypothetical protein
MPYNMEVCKSETVLRMLVTLMIGCFSIVNLVIMIFWLSSSPPPLQGRGNHYVPVSSPLYWVLSIIWKFNERCNNIEETFKSVCKELNRFFMLMLMLISVSLQMRYRDSWAQKWVRIRVRLRMNNFCGGCCVYVGNVFQITNHTYTWHSWYLWHFFICV